MIRKYTSLIKLCFLGIMAICLCAAAQLNFIEARINQRLAATKTQLSVLAMALEAYHLDNLEYPNDVEDGYPTIQLTTPISYVSPELFRDPFRAESAPTYHPRWKLYRYINYVACIEHWGGLGPSWIGWRPAVSEPKCLAGMAKYGKWKLLSVGPDTYVNDRLPEYCFFSNNLLYDPTNGIDSEGDIIRYQKQEE
jgi:hypothetical protein